MATPAIPNNLPLQLSSFIGRAREIEEVTRLLRPHPNPPPHAGEGGRLVTLTGAGGCGKTRLALEVASDLTDLEDLLGLYADGIWFIDLAPLSDPSLIIPTVAAALGLQERLHQALSEQLALYVREHDLLLVIDNCEHLIETCAPLVEAWLQQSPRLRVLATSREVLNIAGERVHRVQPLSTPPLQDATTAVRVIAFESVQLFVARAQAAQPDFRLTDANAPAAARICARLAGMPLALELAAARMAAFSAEQIAARLDDVFSLLVGGRRTALPRQQTLRATLDWSYGLLSVPEQRVFRCLSNFAGGWTLEAAESVCGGANAASEVANALAQLVNKSLVVAEDKQGETRYRLLEPIRQYAAEKLMEAGGEPAVRARHLEYFTHLAETAERKFEGVEQVSWLDRIEADLDNVRLALDRPADARETELQLRLAAALRIFWYAHGHQTECIETLQQLLARPAAAGHTAAHAKALSVLSEFYDRVRNYPLAKRAAEEALAIARELSDKRLTAVALDRLGFAYAQQGLADQARPLLEESAALYQAMGDLRGANDALSGMGQSALRTGDYERAIEIYSERAALHRAAGDNAHLAIALRMAGHALFYLHRPGAGANFLESLRLNMGVSDRQGTAASLAACAAIAVAYHRFESAARLLGASEVMLETIRADLWPYDNDLYVARVAALNAQMPEAAFKATWAAGRALTMAQAAAEAESVVAAAEGTALPAATPPSPLEAAGLTAREVEVLRLLARGLTDAEIAETLVISTRTVHAHLRSIYSRLDVNTRTAAARAASDLKLV